MSERPADPMVELAIVRGDLVRRLLSMADCIEVMERALAEHGRGAVRVPVRESFVTGSGVLAFMPAELGESGLLGYKAVTVFGGNRAHGLPVHQALVALLDARTGRLAALVDGTAITALRTAAVSAVATRALARADASTLAILGTGVQAHAHLESIPLVRPIRRVVVWGRTPGEATRLVDVARSRGFEVAVAGTAEEALAGADVVVTATSAGEPILRREWLSPGAHVNAVGSCFPDIREIDAATVAAAEVYVDDLAAALVEAGDLLLAIRDGAIDAGHVRGSLGEVLAGRLPGRTREDAITLFESLGLGLEDVAVAAEVVARAQHSGAATVVTL